MSVAYLPSPARGIWHFGPVPVRAYALCVIIAVVIALWLTDRRYRRMGGPRGMIWDVATVAVPVGIVGARLYSVLTDYRAYLGAGHDWVSVFRIWDGGLGVTGVVGAGAIGAWAYCRRSHYSLAPMALAAAPALAVAQAIGAWGNWFSQRMYGTPSTLPFAVAIGPERRVNGYESFATFQPVFLYESAWDLLVAAAVAYAIRRFALTGDRAFALYAGLYAIGRLVAETTRIDYTPRVLGLRLTMIGMAMVVIAAVGYLGVSRVRGGQPAPPPAADQAVPDAPTLIAPAAALPVTASGTPGSGPAVPGIPLPGDALGGVGIPGTALPDVP